MGVRRLACRLAVSTGALAVVAACSTSSVAPAPAGSADAGAGADASAKAGDVSDAGARVANTTCGDLPILGRQGKTVTAACAACVDSKCCAEANACRASAACAKLRGCFAACETVDSKCTGDCGADSGVIAENDAFITCRNTKCAAECADLACVGAVKWDAPQAATRSLVITVVDFETRDTVAGALVKVCKNADVSCASPTTQGTSSSDGTVTLDVPMAAEGIDGYLEITGASRAPTLSVVTYANNAKGFEQGKVNPLVLSTSTFSLLTGAAGITVDPARGSVVFQTTDCSDGVTAGLAVSVDLADASSKTVYLAGGLPSTTATQSDTTGAGAVTNLPPGSATVTTKVAASGQRVGALKVPVRAGFLTSMNAGPTP